MSPKPRRWMQEMDADMLRAAIDYTLALLWKDDDNETALPEQNVDLAEMGLSLISGLYGGHISLTALRRELEAARPPDGAVAAWPCVCGKTFTNKSNQVLPCCAPPN